MCLLSLFSQGQVALPSLSACGWTAGAAVASSQRLVVQLRLVSSQKDWSCPLGFPAEGPRSSECSAGKCRLSGEGVVSSPLGYPLKLAQVRVLGLDLVSPFPGVSKGSKGQQGATRIVLRGLDGRGHLGDILSQCHPGLG